MTARAPIAMFRFDASSKIGGGHAMRCLTLAQAMTEGGWQCRFAVGPDTLQTVRRAALREIDCVQLSGNAATEAEAMAGALGGRRCDLVVVDHYGRGAEFETACRGFADRVLVIDDLADRQHDADLLLDQNLGRDAAAYAGLVPADCRLLLGPAYAPLRPEFAIMRDRVLAQRRSRNGIGRILVSFGMADLNELALRTLHALSAIGYDGHVDVVIGGGGRGMARIHAAAAEVGPLVRVLSDVEDMATLMADADLAIGAGGTTSWERCALGLPALIVVVADNQAAVAA
ncbi:MAG: UDP-2,4-diacetamido-2,4,6-trideoxy-beta-L-altropyranose hydrolase, partial [Rhodospirillaceae bacterium]